MFKLSKAGAVALLALLGCAALALAGSEYKPYKKANYKSNMEALAYFSEAYPEWMEYIEYAGLDKLFNGKKITVMLPTQAALEHWKMSCLPSYESGKKPTKEWISAMLHAHVFRGTYTKWSPRKYNSVPYGGYTSYTDVKYNGKETQYYTAHGEEYEMYECMKVTKDMTVCHIDHVLMAPNVYCDLPHLLEHNHMDYVGGILHMLTGLYPGDEGDVDDNGARKLLGGGFDGEEPVDSYDWLHDPKHPKTIFVPAKDAILDLIEYVKAYAAKDESGNHLSQVEDGSEVVQYLIHLIKYHIATDLYPVDFPKGKMHVDTMLEDAHLTLKGKRVVIDGADNSQKVQKPLNLMWPWGVVHKVQDVLYPSEEYEAYATKCGYDYTKYGA
jgi:hypothetical protein